MLIFGITMTSSCLVYHGYALLVHKYNRIRAKARLQYLEENPNKNTKLVFSFGLEVFCLGFDFP